VHHNWTTEEEKRFEEAFKLFGDGPTNNRKIANYINPAIHPNQVALYKQEWKKRKLLEKQTKEWDKKK